LSNEKRVEPGFSATVFDERLLKKSLQAFSSSSGRCPFEQNPAFSCRIFEPALPGWRDWLLFQQPINGLLFQQPINGLLFQQPISWLLFQQPLGQLAGLTGLRIRSGSFVTPP
jgi:hypothetical protein